jgi:hypothetical protein
MLTPTCGFQILFVARQIYEGDHFRRFLAHLNVQEAIKQESLGFLIIYSYSSQSYAKRMPFVRISNFDFA